MERSGHRRRDHRAPRLERVPEQGANAPCVAIGIGAFAALGALIDRAHEGTTTVYAASPGSCGTP